VGALPLITSNTFGMSSASQQQQQEQQPRRSQSSRQSRGGRNGGGNGEGGGRGGGGGGRGGLVTPDQSPRVFAGLSFSEAQFTPRGTATVNLTSPGADMHGGGAGSQGQGQRGNGNVRGSAEGPMVAHGYRGGEGEGEFSGSESDGGGAFTDRSDTSSLASARSHGGAVQLLNPVYPYLKLLGFTPRAYEVKTRFQSLLLQIQVVPLHRGEHPVFSKIRHGRVDEVAAALGGGGGFQPEMRDRFGNTPLIVAAQNNRKRISKLCVRAGVPLDAINAQGNSALHYSYGYGYFELGEYLVAKGADPEVRNGDGMTPRDTLTDEQLRLLVGLHSLPGDRLVTDHTGCHQSLAVIN
jgi:hypothetical protein